MRKLLRYGGPEHLEVSATLLFSFDGFKECLKVSFSERASAFALDDLKKHGGAILNGLGKDLEKVAILFLMVFPQLVAVAVDILYW